MTTTATADTVTAPPPSPPADKAPKSTGATRTKPAAAGAAAKPPGDKKRGRGRPSNAEFKAACVDLVERLASAVVLAGVFSPRLAYDGEILTNNADTIATELYERGLSNPKLRKLLEQSNATVEWARLLAIITGVGIPIAANHGLLPAELTALVGAPPPPPRPVKKPKVPKPAADDAPRRGRPDVDQTDESGPSTDGSEPGRTPSGFALAFAPDGEAGGNGRGT